MKFDRSKTEISDERLEELMGRVQPLVQKGGKLYRIKEVNPRNIAFTWSPELLDEVPAEKVHELLVNDTHHSCGYGAFFKPTIAECLAQHPVDPFANAFYLDADTIQTSPCGGGHIASCHWVRISQ
jgi:hypothetical protein